MLPNRWLISLAFVAMLPIAANGHALALEVRSTDSKVTVDVFYDDDTPAIEAKVVLMDERETIVQEGRTDAKGVWSTSKLRPGRYRVVADAGDGHVAKKRFFVTDQSDPTSESTTGDNGSIVSDGPTRAETTGVRRWLLTALGLAAIALGTVLVRYVTRRRVSLPAKTT